MSREDEKKAILCHAIVYLKSQLGECANSLQLDCYKPDQTTFCTIVDVGENGGERWLFSQRYTLSELQNIVSEISNVLDWQKRKASQ